MNDYYVYVILDPRFFGPFKYGLLNLDLDPFYIGLSNSDRRFYMHLRESYVENKKSHKCSKIRKIKRITGVDPIFKILKENLTFEEAKFLEKSLIKEIGRNDLKRGPLTNLTDGGDGVGGLIVSEERKQHLREITRGNKNPFYGRTHTEESKKLVSVKNKGKESPFKNKKHTEETKKIFSDKKKGLYDGDKNPMYGVHRHGSKNPNAKYKYLIYKDDMFIGEELDLKNYCKTNGLSYINTLKRIKEGKSFKGLLIKRVLKIKEDIKNAEPSFRI